MFIPNLVNLFIDLYSFANLEIGLNSNLLYCLVIMLSIGHFNERISLNFFTAIFFVIFLSLIIYKLAIL